jgi:hypothetical protein
MEGPKWKVCLREKDNTNSAVLFTVESVFQESQPGYPHLLITNGVEVVQKGVSQWYRDICVRSRANPESFPGPEGTAGLDALSSAFAVDIIAPAW